MDKGIKQIVKSIGIKMGILLCISVPLSALVAYFDAVSFFKVMKIMGVLFVIAGVAAFLPSERAAINNFRNPSILTEDKYYAKGKKPYYERILKGNIIVFSKGAMQVIIAAMIIIGIAFLLD
jgi:hypothetical protein